MKVVLITLSLAAVAVMGHAKAAKALLARDVSIGACPTFSNKEDLDPVPVSVFSTTDNYINDFFFRDRIKFCYLRVLVLPSFLMMISDFLLM